jgi:DNA-binding NarL/FixJ family response regulator
VIKVAIYEDNDGLRETLASIIRDSSDFTLAGEFGHCLDVLENTAAFKPNVVIMDIDMPGLNGIDGTRMLKKSFPEVEIIIHTVFNDDYKILQALFAGATGYLLKNSSIQTILDSIKEVYNGGAPMSSQIARKVLQLNIAKVKKDKSDLSLTEREFEILNLLSKGLSYKMVAEHLFISIDTVRAHIKKIYEKLHVHSITEAIYKVFIETK